MKVEELMVDDWVKYIPTGNFIRIVGLIKHYLHDYTVYAYTGTYNQLQSFSSDYVEPIDITEELLLKIGFKKYDSEGSDDYPKLKYSEHTEDYHLCISIEKIVSGWYIKTINGKDFLFKCNEFHGTINYINELQHILSVNNIDLEIDIPF